MGFVGIKRVVFFVRQVSSSSIKKNVVSYD